MSGGEKPGKGVFIGWSGSRSGVVAQALRYWLQCLSTDVEPWVSSVDSRFGGPWWDELQTELTRSAAGILCITPENKDSPWLHFEAGALARSVRRPLVVPYAVGMDTAAISSPISIFQGATANEQDTFRMISHLLPSIGAEYDGDSNIFEVFWPLFEKVLKGAEGGTETAESAIRELERVASARRSTELKEFSFPRKVLRGETLSLEYLVETKAQDVAIWLGASICIAPGAWLNNQEQDEVITLERGLRRYRRPLTVPDTTRPGEYGFNAELWFGPKSDPRRSYAIQRKWTAGQIRIE
jgi:hypothetical protein